MTTDDAPLALTTWVTGRVEELRPGGGPTTNYSFLIINHSILFLTINRTMTGYRRELCAKSSFFKILTRGYTC